jgi:hypothetical protein
MTISTLSAITATATTATAGTPSTTGSASATQAAAQATSTSPVAAALKKADARVQSQRDATGAQLSSLGRLKSAVSDVQLAARAAGGLTGSASAADTKTAVSRFVTAFNASLAAAKATSADLAASDANTTTAALGARRVGSELGRSFASMGASDALRKAGFKQGADGTLTVDATKLDAALKADPASVQAALAKLGQATEAVATKELASGGRIAKPLTALNQRATALKGQHDAMVTMAQNLSASTSSSSSSQTAPSTSYVNYGIAAYRSNA